MDIFEQNKLLKRVVFVMLLLNIACMAVVLWRGYSCNPGAPRDPADFRDVSSVLKKELKLSDAQEEKMRDLRTEYFKKESGLSKVIRGERDSMNVAMFNKDINEELVKALASRISANEYNIEMLRFEQAKDLKAICNEEQLKRFEGLIIEIRDYFRPDNQPPKK